MMDFLRRLFYGREEANVEEAGELEKGEEDRSFTVEHAANIIEELPQEVSRQSALRIVRQTLEAAGIGVEGLQSSTRMREAKRTSEIEMGKRRIEELRKDANEKVRSLREEVRRVREDRDFWITEEEHRISEARDGLSDVEKVCEFFGFPEEQGETESPEEGGLAEDNTTVICSSDSDESTRRISRGPLSDEEENGGR
jgi:hypothetical protein